MTSFDPPSVVFQGRLWTAEEIRATARGWAAVLADRLPEHPHAVASVIENRPEGVALYFALSTVSTPIVLLPNDPKAWRTSPPVPPGTPVVLPPGSALAAEAARIGADALVLPDAHTLAAGRTRLPPFLTAPGVVLFTAGSTGPPRAVYRTTASLLAQATALARAFGLHREGRILGAVPLGGAHGLPHAVFVATVSGSSLALVERFRHRAVLGLFAAGGITYFPCTPLMIDVLARCWLQGSAPPAPPVIKVSTGRLSGPLTEAFRRRFGVSPRPSYGSTEAGTITADWGPADAVRPDTVGRPLPGVRLVVGDDAHRPAPAGEAGRLWISTPWFMEGYGFPPALEPALGPSGLWPSQDVGHVDADGYLTLVGRVDDCFKTPAGHLVNPAEIARAFERCAGVREVAVVPLGREFGSAIGVLVAGADTLDVEALREHATRHLPAWCRPHAVLVVPELPRLPRGKVDRLACIARLGAARTEASRPT